MRLGYAFLRLSRRRAARHRENGQAKRNFRLGSGFAVSREWRAGLWRTINQPQ
jgi:hypothetical protein